ncbi:ABC transporter permease [Bacillus sp. 196mf]|uniref:ABC transporter permease n=1 Tax=Bacillus sp. 196mf TaxID=1761754 RepID=UPI000D7B9EB7|nr:ABC transporter permease [Bacillus sp. 196mf]
MILKKYKVNATDDENSGVYHTNFQSKKTNALKPFLQKNIFKYISLFSVISILLIWEFCAQLALISPLFLPAPSSIIQAAMYMLIDGELQKYLLASLSRIGTGYIIGSLLGIIFGLFLGFSKLLNAIFAPLIYFIYPIPKIALLPLIILWLGIGELPKISIISLGVFFPVFINTYSGVKNISSTLMNVASIFKTKRRRILFEILLPGSLPSIFTGLKVGAGTSLLLLIAAEMIAAQEGIGAMILHYGSLMITTKLMVGVFTLSFIGLLFNRLLNLIEKFLLSWN